VPTPNYGYEKRQKELAKRRKKEDKLRARAERKTDPSQPDGESLMDDGPADAVAAEDRVQDPSGASASS
jgi:hypothetical protein